MNDGEILLTNSIGNKELALQACQWITNRRDELAAKADALAITEANYADPATVAAVEELETAVEDLREMGKRLVSAVLDATVTKPVITKIDSRLWTYSTQRDEGSAYVSLSKRLKAAKDAIKGFKDAAKPRDPNRVYVCAIETNGDGWKALMKALDKAGVALIAYAVPQTDKAVREIKAWLNKNA